MKETQTKNTPLALRLTDAELEEEVEVEKWEQTWISNGMAAGSSQAPG